jgi:hypothetical protein
VGLPRPCRDASNDRDHQHRAARLGNRRCVLNGDDIVDVDGGNEAVIVSSQDKVREGKPKLAIPLLTEVLQERPETAPPVEQLLLAQVHLALNELEETKRFHQAAVDWLDKPHDPRKATEVMKQLKTLFKIPKPLDDRRYNPFDRESWHECDVLRAAVEKALQAGIRKPAAAE